MRNSGARLRELYNDSMNNPPIDEVLNKAFSLACFILDDRATAIQSVEKAMARLEVTTAAQGKRLYYKPAASDWVQGKKSERYRNKVFFGELHLLQRLIYIASEVFEKNREQTFTAGDAAEKEMLIHFVKHLIRITTRRNSFYVTLGINRLLYNYTTAETMETFNAVIQDPARVKDDYYYRSRKGVLMQELKNRFGSFLNVARGPRGEERFHASSPQTRFADLVKECLSVFTPWNTYCLVPAVGNPIVDGIPDFSSQGKQAEDKIEVDRIHAVLHPDCFERLIGMLGFDRPQERLEVPHFFLTGDSNATGSGPAARRESSTSLSSNELEEIKSHLDDQSARRKRDFAGMLRVLVDGKERARLTPSHSASTRFALDGDAELIEVRSMVNGDDLLLASHLFVNHELANEPNPEVSSIVLEGGQEVSIKISSLEGAGQTIVDVAYRQTGLLRSVISFFKRPSQSSAGGPVGLRWSPARLVPLFVLGFLFLAFAALGTRQLLRQRNLESTKPVTETNNGQPVMPGSDPSRPPGTHGESSSGDDKAAPLASSPVDKRNGSQNGVASSGDAQLGSSQSPLKAGTNRSQPDSRERENRETVVRRPDPDERNTLSSKGNRPATDTTRTINGEATVVPFSEVRKIYVEVTGDAASRLTARAKLIEALNGTAKLMSVDSKDEADALLKIKVTRLNSQSANVVARVTLINPRGETIWRGSDSRGTYQGSYESVAADIVKGLLDDASSTRRR